MQTLLPGGYPFYQFTLIKNTHNFPYTDYTIYTIVVLYAKILNRLTCLPQKYFKQCEEYRTMTLSRRTKNSEKQLVISEKIQYYLPGGYFYPVTCFFLNFDIYVIICYGSVTSHLRCVGDG